MQVKQLAGIVFLITFLLGFSSSSLAEEEMVLSLEKILEEISSHNPEIKAAERKWKAAQEKIPQARALPDPMFAYTYFGEEIETRDGPQEEAFSISQKFPSFGKLRLRGEMALQGALIAEEKYQATKQKILTQAKKSYAELYWIYKTIEITEEIKELLNKFEKIAEIRYSTGQGVQQNVLRAQVEISKLIDKLLVLEQMRVTINAKINILMNRPPETFLGQPENLDIFNFPYSIDELYKIAEENRQEIRAAGFATEKARAAHRLAKKENLPNFTAGLKHIEIGEGTSNSPDKGEDAWMATLAINLPIWQNRIWAGVKEARANLEASQEMLQHTKNTTSFQVKDAYFRLITTKDLVELYRTALILQAEQSLKATESGYETGKATFLDLLDSERALLGIKIAYYRAIADYQKNLADLERAVGIELVNNPAEQN